MSAMPNPNALLDAALEYAARGWHVVPLHNPAAGGCSCGRSDCASPAKHPRTKNGLKDGTADADTIIEWWQRWPSANIGLRTGIGFDVLDVDGDDGRASLKAAIAEYGDLPAGPRTKTGSGGSHILFAPTGGGNRAGLLLHVDWRGRNGYIVAPPSMHACGAPYAWRTAPDLALPAAPDWLAALVNPPRVERPAGQHQPLPVGITDGTPYGLQALAGEIADLRNAGEGTRNDTLNETAFVLFQLVAGGQLSERVVEQQLRDAAFAIGLGDHEISQTIASARAGLNQPRTPKLTMLHGGLSSHPTPPAPRPDDAADDDPSIDQALIDLVTDEYGIHGPEAWKVAEQVSIRIVYERSVTLARRLIRDEQLVQEADLGSIAAINVNDLLAQERVERTPLFGQLLAEGHNATIVARWKVGKSTFVDNAAIAAASGGMFLGRFQVPQPRRVVLFNYELHEDDMTDRLAGYAIPTGAGNNIEIVNLRGRRLPLGTPKGREITARILADLAADLWIVDPFGAAFAAAGGQDENSNAEVRRFLIALDEIKRIAGCASLLMPVHTGRKTDAEGDEQGRGATVLEDWPDVRMLLTRGQKEQRNDRFLRTEGRAWDLEESRLSFDPHTKGLGLPQTEIGVSRSKAQHQRHARVVVDVVADTPGITRNALFDVLNEQGITSNTDRVKSLDFAREKQLVHFHEGQNRKQHHYVGGVHPDAEPCPGGWQNS